MALTSDEIASIAVDVGLGRPLRIKGAEAEKMAVAIKKDMEIAKAKGWVLDIPFEIPSVV